MPVLAIRNTTDTWESYVRITADRSALEDTASARTVWNSLPFSFYKSQWPLEDLANVSFLQGQGRSSSPLWPSSPYDPAEGWWWLVLRSKAVFMVLAQSEPLRPRKCDGSVASACSLSSLLLTAIAFFRQPSLYIHWPSSWCWLLSNCSASSFQVSNSLDPFTSDPTKHSAASSATLFTAVSANVSTNEMRKEKTTQNTENQPAKLSVKPTAVTLAAKKGISQQNSLRARAGWRGYLGQ